MLIHVRSAKNYYKTPGARELAHRLKIGDKTAISVMASDMSKLIPNGSTLIPIPGRNGVADTSLLLATEISKHTNSVVVDLIKGVQRDSLYILKKKDVEVDEKLFGFELTSQPNFQKIVLIDGVCDTGGTALSAGKLFQHNVMLVTHSSHFEKGIGKLSFSEKIKPSLQAISCSTLSLESWREARRFDQIDEAEKAHSRITSI
tara:strand:+ start:61095 stop:61703 length:609 start_codon:yes stop_codon:yes gene_type:complete